MLCPQESSLSSSDHTTVAHSLFPINTHCSISSVPLYCKHDAFLKRPHSHRNNIHPAVESRQPGDTAVDIRTLTRHYNTPSVQHPTHLTTTIPNLDTPGDYEQRQQPIHHALLTHHGIKYQTYRRCGGPFSRIRSIGEDWPGLLWHHSQGQEEGNGRDPGAQGDFIRRHVAEGKGTIARRNQSA